MTPSAPALLAALVTAMASRTERPAAAVTATRPSTAVTAISCRRITSSAVMLKNSPVLRQKRCCAPAAAMSETMLAVSLNRLAVAVVAVT